MDPIKLISQNFFKELSTASVNWLLGNVGDKIRVETTFAVEVFAISTPDNPFILNNTSGMVGAGWVQDDLSQFVNFKIGDTILAYNQLTSTYDSHTIVDKIDAANIQVSPAFGGGNNNAATNFIISLTTPITAVKYHYNFIENGSANTFLSHIDGSEQQLVIESKLASSTGAVAMKFNCPLTCQSGSATIQGVVIDDGTTDGVYKSTYKIIHYTKITPFILYDQIQNQIDGIAPKDFQKTKCWKFITQIEAAEVYTNPNFLVSEIFDTFLGNNGWYGENFNTSKTNYSISNLVYKNAGQTVDSIQFDDSETTITFDIDNTVDAPFSEGDTQFVIGFFKVPADPSEYQNNNTLLDRNFLFDRALQTVGAAPVNGDNYGGSYQVLKSISAVCPVGVSFNATKISVTVKIDMAALVLAGFSESSTPQYFLYVTTQDFSLVTADPYNDLVTLQVDMNEFTVISSDPDMIIPSNVFIRHPEVDPSAEGVTIGFGLNSIDSEEITLGSSNAPGLMELNPTENKLYAIVGNKLKSYNLATNAAINSLTIASGELNQLTFDSENNRIYIANGSNDNVKVINCTNDTLLATITVGALAYGAKFCPVNNYVYVSNYSDGTISVIDTATNAVVDTITVGNNPGYIEYNSLQNEMYVSNETDNTVSVIDCVTDTVIATINVVDDSTWLTYNSTNNTIYVHCYSLLKIIDCGTKTLLAATVTGIYNTNSSTFDVTYNQLYVSDATVSALAVVNCLSNEIIYTKSFSTNTLYFIIDNVNEKLFISNGNVTTGIIYVLQSNFKVFPEDEIVACSDFYIESAGRTTDEIKLTSIQAKIIASDGTDEFELDGFTMQLGAYPLTGYTQQFDAQVARGFHIPTGTIRKYIEVKRRNDLDTGTRKYFSSNYPLLWRWETWATVLGVDSSFFDSSLPNNGFNHWWFHYKTGEWNLFYKLIINATKNGDPQRYELQNKIIPHDYNSNSAWTTKSITTFDPDSLDSLVTGGDTYINGFKNTLVVATFEKSTLPTVYTVVIGIEAYQAGGIYGKRRYSSKWVADSDTWFTSLDGGGKVTLAIAGNIVTAKALIDYTKLPTGVTSYKLSARIYDAVGNALTTDDGVDITTDDGVSITID